MLRRGNEGSGSWEGEVDVERARERTWFAVVGSQWGVWGGGGAVVVVVLALKRVGWVVRRWLRVVEAVGRVAKWTRIGVKERG